MLIYGPFPITKKQLSRPKKTKPIVETGLRALSKYDLKCLCYKNDALAIAEYERRLWGRA